MALTLITTVGGATSNSYCTIEEADAFNETNLYSEWHKINPIDKIKTLITGSRLIDEQCLWNGVKADEDQALEWPRSGVYDSSNNLIDDEIIPTFLKNAVAEYARLLNVSDLTADADTKGFSEIKVGSIELKIDKDDRDSTLVLPYSVWNMVQAYGMKAAKNVKLIRS